MINIRYHKKVIDLFMSKDMEHIIDRLIEDRIILSGHMLYMGLAMDRLELYLPMIKNRQYTLLLTSVDHSDTYTNPVFNNYLKSFIILAYCERYSIYRGSIWVNDNIGVLDKDVGIILASIDSSLIIPLNKLVLNISDYIIEHG